MADNNWRPIETASRIIGPGLEAETDRLLLCGVWEGHKWIEICHLDRNSGTWMMAVGGSVLGETHWQPLPDFPEDM